MRRRAGVSVIALVVALGACNGDDELVARGWVEGREVDIGPLTGGRLVSVRVDEGDTVAVGDTIALLSMGATASEADVARARVATASARLRELEHGPRREDIAAARATLEGAEAELSRARRELERVESLDSMELSSAQTLDSARAATAAALSRRDVAQANLARLTAGTRPEELAAARAELSAARAALAGAESIADELVLVAPVAGPVTLRAFDPGEVVGAGAPVVTVLAGDERWIRVWVPQRTLGQVRVGTDARVRIDGLPDTAFAATVATISTHAEFTPRVALTDDERADLMYALRMTVDDPGGLLRVGLPVEADFSAALE